MRRSLFLVLALSLLSSSVFAQDLNKVVFGPLEGDEAGVLTVHNGDAIEIEMWVRTDPDNPAPVIAVAHALLSQDAIIAERNGAEIQPEYCYHWEQCGVDGPFVHDPEDNSPIPEGYTCEIQWALCNIFGNCPYPIDTQGEWDFYGAFLMTCNTGVDEDSTYYPFSEGWYPPSGQGTVWAFDVPPGGNMEPEQDYGGLHFAPKCDYVPGDCDCNGIANELTDATAMFFQYRGYAEPCYTCFCPPHGEHFAANSDPDGDCVPLEMSDVVIMFDWPLWPPLGCPDCPSWDRLGREKAENARIVPTLKSKVRIEKQIENGGLK